MKNKLGISARQARMGVGRLYPSCIAAAMFLSSVAGLSFASSKEDHLESVPDIKVSNSYRKLWQAKLFVTPGEIARFVQIPNYTGEVAVSVYKDPKSINTYVLTKTESPVPLLECLNIPNASKRVDPQKVHVKRSDARLPKSTALAIRTLWLAMLEQAKPGPDPDTYISVDSTTEYFSAEAPDGKLLEAAAPRVAVGPNAKTNQLIRIGFLLLDYCELHPPDRPQLARKIEKAAAALENRVAAKQN